MDLECIIFVVLLLHYQRNIQKFHFMLRFVYKHLKNNLDKSQNIQKESRIVVEDRTRIKFIRKENNYFGWLAVTCLSSFRNSDSRGYTLVSSMYYNIIEE